MQHFLGTLHRRWAGRGDPSGLGERGGEKRSVSGAACESGEYKGVPGREGKEKGWGGTPCINFLSVLLGGLNSLVQRVLAA